MPILIVYLHWNSSKILKAFELWKENLLSILIRCINIDLSEVCCNVIFRCLIFLNIMISLIFIYMYILIFYEVYNQ